MITQRVSLLLVATFIASVYAPAQNDIPPSRAGLNSWDELRCTPEKASAVTGQRAYDFLTWSRIWGRKDDQLCWCSIAVNKKYAKAYAAMGDFYEYGFGVPVDKSLAFRWRLAGAQAGDKDAMGVVAANYHNGHGVEKNEAEAARWQLAQLGPEGVRKLQQEAAKPGPKPDISGALLGMAVGGVIGTGDSRATSSLDARVSPPGTDPGGFGKAKWGMTREQVMRAYPDARDYNEDGHDFLGIEYFSINKILFLLQFSFRQGTVGGGFSGVTLRPNSDGLLKYPSGTIADAESYLETTLTKQFGDPEILSNQRLTSYSWALGTTRVRLALFPGGADRTVDHHLFSATDPRYNGPLDSVRQEVIVGGPSDILLSYTRIAVKR